MFKKRNPRTVANCFYCVIVEVVNVDKNNNSLSFFFLLLMLSNQNALKEDPHSVSDEETFLTRKYYSEI